MASYKSYCITIRPKAGLNEEIIKNFDWWIRNKCKGGVYVFEKTDAERHIHAQVFCENPRSKSNIKKDLIKYVQNEKTDPDWSPSSKKVLGGGIRIAYNSDFAENYMMKEAIDYEYCCIPDDEYSYYPTQEEQETVIADNNSRNPLLLRLSRWWREEEDQTILITEQRVAVFLQRLFIEDRIVGLMNARSRLEQRRLLYAYIARHYRFGSLYSTETEREDWNTMEALMAELPIDEGSIDINIVEIGSMD